MIIEARDLGKKFQGHWIFRHLNLSCTTNKPVAITGPNGSGKSTLLRLLCHMMPANEGSVHYKDEQDTPLATDHVHHFLSLAAPYLELVEEFTLQEMVDFHFKFKKLQSGLDVGVFEELLPFQKHAHKSVGHFSSGMKQRLKLGLALFSNTPVLMLDEPTNNLDREGIDWYREHLVRYSQDRLLIISSNDPVEYEGVVEEVVDLEKHLPTATSQS